MANKIMGLVLILFGLALGVFDCASMFRNGLYEGLDRMTNMKPEQVWLLIGAVIAILIGLTGLFKKKK